MIHLTKYRSFKQVTEQYYLPPNSILVYGIYKRKMVVNTVTLEFVQMVSFILTSV